MSDEERAPYPSAHRYELSMFIGPCSEDDAVELSGAIIQLGEFTSVGGGGIAIQKVADDDPLFEDLPPPSLEDFHGEG